jgi:nitrogen fixation protein NifU and related proteins
MAYSNAVIDHYENPRNVGSFDKSDADVGTGMVGAPACGDVMKLQIKVDDATGTITDARLKLMVAAQPLRRAVLSLSGSKEKLLTKQPLSRTLKSPKSWPYLR